MLTVADLVGHPGLGLDLVAGRAGAQRPIRWLTFTEEVDLTPWLRGGELLITTGLALKDANLHGELIDYALRIFDGCGRGSLANGHFGACGIEHTDRLVRELSSRDVAMRQPHRVFNGLVQKTFLALAGIAVAVLLLVMTSSGVLPHG